MSSPIDRQRVEPVSIELAELQRIVPHALAGARALRSMERWARASLLPTDAAIACEHAAALEAFADAIDPDWNEADG